MTQNGPSLSEAVLSAIADHEGVDQVDPHPPLYDAVDPECLDNLFRNSHGQVIFEYHGYIVSVDHEGSVDLV